MANYYQDIDIYGSEKSDGTPFELLNEEAVKNALTLWLTSKSGDFLKNPMAGGLLDRILFKNMEGSSIGSWLFSIKNALYFEFSPAITLVDIKIDKDYSARYLKLEFIYIINNNNNTIQKLEIFTKNLKSIPEQKQQDIAYTGKNLLMFCTIRKPDMENELLIYSTEELLWRWGIYVFTNLVESDPEFENILAVCNG